MTTPKLQLAINDWRRRANQFEQAGVPESAWEMLYKRDLYNVGNLGGTPMTDADVYAGVQSAMHGPQIQDPKPEHGGHGWWSGITDVIGNISSDIKGIVTGFGPGIAHVVAHLPSELENSGELIYHLAEGDNKWLHDKGYLQPGDNLHESWSDFGTILRAMDANGSKQLLPILPFISDLANMTTAQGRNILMQHPVGTVMDVWPGLAGAGKLAMAGRDFSMAAMAERAGFPEQAELLRNAQKAEALQSAQEVTLNKGVKAGQRAGERRMQAAMTDYDPNRLPAGMKEPRLWAAGRALQRGSPLRALVSATGDIIPFEYDEFGRVTTLRQKVNTVAAAAGFTSMIRESVVRPFEDMKQEAKARIDTYTKMYFGDKIWKGIKPDRAMYMWKIAHLVDPQTNKPFQTVAEYNAYRATLTVEENAAMDVARDLTEAQRRAAIKAGWAAELKLAHGVVTVSTNSKLWMAYKNLTGLLADLKNAPNLAIAKKISNDIQKAKDEYDQAQIDAVPAEWNDAMAAHIRMGAKQTVTQMLTGQALKDAINVIDHSPYSADFERVLGPGQAGQIRFQELKADAIRWWWKMQDQGMAPLWMHDIHPDKIDSTLAPKLDTIAKERTPKMFKGKAYEAAGREAAINFHDFLNAGDTVMDIAAVVNRTQAEMIWAELNTNLVKTFIAPRAYTYAARSMEYQKALDEAKKTLSPEAAKKLPTVQKLIAENFVRFDPEHYGLKRVDFQKEDQQGLLLDKDTAEALKKLVKPPPVWARNTVVRKGTALYKFAVLTGPRHLAHVGVGGFTMLMGGEPLAPLQFFKAARLIAGKASPEDYGLAGSSLAGLKEDYYKMGPRHTYQDYKIEPHRGWLHQVGKNIGEHYTTDLVHQAAQAGKTVAEFVPNRLSQLETWLMTMYKTSTYLSRRSRGMDEKMAIEGAHKLFVDMNGMSRMERTVLRQVFPFYAFTRHLFRYLGTYPVDYPLRAAIITNFAEQEQADWNNGLSRSYQSLFFLGSTNSLGDVRAFDLKNANPFRSFANDFSLAGFTSSLSPFVTSVLGIAGFDTLSGTTQLYPGSHYDPFTGSLQADPQPGWQFTVMDAFVPQFGLLDHFKKLTQATKFIAATDPAAYRKQLYNMINMPFMPEMVNIPYAKEITEMRRFRQATSQVALVRKNPSPQNVAKLLEFNAVPFDNRLVLPGPLAAYYKQVHEVLARAHMSQISPEAVVRAPVQRKATFGGELAPVVPTSGG